MHLSLYDVLFCVTCLCIQKTSVVVLCYFLFFFFFSFYWRWSRVVVPHQAGSRAGSSWTTASSLTTTARTTSVKEARAPSRCLCVTSKVRECRESCQTGRVDLPDTDAMTLINVCSHVIMFQVHPTDVTRLELIIPGEQHFYVRAVNAAERQRWLVALGSSKAGTLDSHKHRGTHAHMHQYGSALLPH